MSAIDHVSEERLRMFVDEALPYRLLLVQISRADERRLRRNIVQFNEDVPEDPMDPASDDDLATTLAGCATRGLDEGDLDAGKWSDIDGRCYDLPRPNRLSVRARLRFAYRAAVPEWRDG